MKAVWLPPPWQAIATLVRPAWVIRITVGHWSVYPPEAHSERASTGSARTLPVGLHGQVVRQVDGRFDSLVQAEPML